MDSLQHLSDETNSSQISFAITVLVAGPTPDVKSGSNMRDLGQPAFFLGGQKISGGGELRTRNQQVNRFAPYHCTTRTFLVNV